VKVDSWETSPVQVRSGGKVLRTEARRGAIVFPIEPGANYDVVSTAMPEPVNLEKPSKKQDALPE
jgi:hypothetical protein